MPGGGVLIPPPGQSYLDTLVKRTRRMLGDFPDETLSTATMDTDTGFITPPAEDLGKFQTPGLKVEWDDETGEMAVTTAAAQDDGTVPVRRGRYGSTASDHAENATLLFEPRFPFLRVADAVNEVIDGDLWPHVWVMGEQEITWQDDSELYDPAVSDIVEIMYAYQLYSGHRRTVSGLRFTPADAIDDEDWPNGFVTIPRGTVTYGGQNIFIAYKAKPTLFNLPTRQLGLVALGAAATLVMAEEISHVAPSRSAIRDQMQEGAKLRAGAVLRDQFIERRHTERNLLLAAMADQGLNRVAR